MIRHNKTAFTMMEVMIAVIIVGILAAIALPRLTGMLQRRRYDEAKRVVLAMAGAQAHHFLNNGTFATNMTSLDIDVPSSKAITGAQYTILAGASTTAVSMGLKTAAGNGKMGIDMTLQNNRPVISGYWWREDSGGVIGAGTLHSGTSSDVWNSAR
ncbi:MAG: prepilin-type N-terminal cleavage/methylation domain-containing protein [Elusimicrobia bacterium]|nr:prepilin-type N-terminal cleavage/methylation domain-containing protein [Elusimicrobiota bacterium]